MAIKTNINHPLMNELVAMGILTSKSSPYVSGPFRIKTECFTGDSSGGTQTLAQTPVTNGIHAIFTIPTAAGTNNTLSALTQDTHFTLSGTTLTWITDQSANQVCIMYAY